MGEEKKGIKCRCVFTVGLIVLLVGLLADHIGIGGGLGYGGKQIAVIVVGMVLLFLGLSSSKFCKCGKFGCTEKKEQ